MDNIVIKGARENNLKNIDVKFPLGTLTVVTGVSGSGKSSLINEILYKTIARDLDVLRKLLRYSRNEIDQLRQTVNENPDNKVAKARLKELEERIQD